VWTTGCNTQDKDSVKIQERPSAVAAIKLLMETMARDALGKAMSKLANLDEVMEPNELRKWFKRKMS
jgi:hypothetical protein